MTPICPLCSCPETTKIHTDADRAYYHCPVCDLICVERNALLVPHEEKLRYDLHENNPADPNYRNFLDQLAQPLLTRLGPPPLRGLDFGSGPGPTLAIMLAEQGYTMRIYDHYYAPNPHILEETYDFVTCTETFEHFYTPSIEWFLLVNLIKPGGWLGIMTLLHPPLAEFPTWHYINDLTHVSFFSRQTFNFLAQRDRLHVEIIGDHVILFQKPHEWVPQTLSEQSHNQGNDAR